MDWISFQTVTTNPIEMGAHKIQIESKLLRINFPYGGFSFQTPTAVYDLNSGEKQPILDITRVAILSLAGFAFLFSVIAKRKKS